jgi:hypothetical protein
MPEQKAPAPPSPPESLEKRVERLEDLYIEVAERLARLETRVELIASQMATKADIAQLATKAEMAALETRMVKWFVGTAVTLAGLAFAAGKFVH